MALKRDRIKCPEDQRGRCISSAGFLRQLGGIKPAWHQCLLIRLVHGRSYFGEKFVACYPGAARETCRGTKQLLHSDRPRLDVCSSDVFAATHGIIRSSYSYSTSDVVWSVGQISLIIYNKADSMSRPESDFAAWQQSAWLHPHVVQLQLNIRGSEQGKCSSQSWTHQAARAPPLAGGKQWQRHKPVVDRIHCPHPVALRPQHCPRQSPASPQCHHAALACEHCSPSLQLPAPAQAVVRLEATCHCNVFNGNR